jgi:protein-tyrosine phosphatase
MTSHYTSQLSNQTINQTSNQSNDQLIFASFYEKMNNKPRSKITHNLPKLIINPHKSGYTYYPFIVPFDHNATPIIQENNCTIYLGALEHSSDKKFLLNNNIQTIVCVTMEEPSLKNDPEMSHINFLHIPLIDSSSETIQNHFVSFSDFIQEQINLGKSTLVHCHMGISRSATLVCSYLIAKKNMSYRDAIKFIKDKRSQVDPNIGFCFRLEGFEQAVKKL